MYFSQLVCILKSLVSIQRNYTVHAYAVLATYDSLVGLHSQFGDGNCKITGSVAGQATSTYFGIGMAACIYMYIARYRHIYSYMLG